MPQVTSPAPAAPRQTKAERARETTRMARANRRNRPYTLAADGYSAPTALEIEEGAAHKLHDANRGSRMLAEEYREVWWRLYEAEGFPESSRCKNCHVIRFGRPRGVACGHCGAMEVWVTPNLIWAPAPIAEEPETVDFDG